MTNESLIHKLETALRAYLKEFGPADAEASLLGIVGSLLAVQPAALAGAGQDTVAVAQQVVQNVQAGAAGDFDTPVDEAMRSLVEAAHQRYRALKTDVQQVLRAYIQRFAPDGSGESLQAMVLAILPMVDEARDDGQLNPVEVEALVERICAGFQWQEALAATVEPVYGAWAQRLARVLRQQPLEELVRATVVAYVEQRELPLAAVGETLIEQVLQSVTRSGVTFDWEAEVNLEDRQLLIQQVAFKLTVLQASPPPSTTARQIADQVHREIQRFRAEQGETLGTADRSGVASEDGWSVSSRWEFEAGRDDSARDRGED